MHSLILATFKELEAAAQTCSIKKMFLEISQIQVLPEACDFIK